MPIHFTCKQWNHIFYWYTEKGQGAVNFISKLDCTDVADKEFARVKQEGEILHHLNI